MSYGKFENSKEVVDVLYAIVLGSKTPQEMGRELGQSGTTIRSKLLFLRNNNVVIKDKWNYDINWNTVSRKMINATKQVISAYSKLADSSSKKKLGQINANIKDYLPKPLLIGILKSYSLAYFKGYPKTSLKEMMEIFLSQLPSAEDKELTKINKKLIEMKEVLKGIPTKEQFFFSRLVKNSG